MTSMTRDEFSADPGQQDRKAERLAGTARHLRVLEQAAVSSENLTSHPAWNTFLAQLQAAIEATGAQRAAFLEVLADPQIVDHDTLMRTKLALKECDGRIAAWEAAISLPKEIIETGESAKDLLDKLPKVAAA